MTPAAVVSARTKDMPDVPPESVALSLRFLKQFHVCPVGEDETHVDLLMADPQDAYAREAVRLMRMKGQQEG